MMKPRFLLALVLLMLGLIWAPQAPPTPVENNLLARRYREGEKISYQMKGTNQERGKTLAYEIEADGVVKKNSDGFFEEFGWSNLVVNGKVVPLSAASEDSRLLLSLEPGPNVHGLPDLSKVDPMMIGPITDMLTFYADMLIAKTQGKLDRAGDHFYFKHGTPNSWADGSYVKLGQDSIDFEVALTEVDRKDRSAVVVVRHVPPPQPQIKIPAEWMRPAVADTSNNWVQISQAGPGKFSAEIGKETFVATIKISLVDGRIVSATLYNPLEVLARECSDPALTTCGEPIRFQILRQIEIISR
jgi:hypothetical protein